MTYVLIIEDEPDILENLMETLVLEEFDVKGTNNGHDGIDIAMDTQPDIIICDIMMPDINGYDVLSSLRSHAKTTNIPFIFLTAMANRDAQRQGMNLGADDYLTKPFTPAELIETINVRLKKHQAIREEHQKQIDNLRNGLIYSLPHELRTPLTSLMGCADFLVMDYEKIPRENVKQIGELMIVAAERLHQLTENYLLYAQISLAAYDPQKTRMMRTAVTEMSDLTIMGTTTLRAQTEGRDDDIRIEIEDARLAISEENLRRIVDELVSNAIKFSEKGAAIAIKGRIDSGTYELTITDYGRGMTTEQINNIGAYVQFERALYEQQGLGLGLAIAKRLTELHDGTFRIESELKNYLKVFVRLPIRSE